jgi:hypothetical protein
MKVPIVRVSPRAPLLPVDWLPGEALLDEEHPAITMAAKAARLMPRTR